MSLSKLDIFEPLPEELKGKYDVVHLRFFMTVARDDNVQTVIKNLRDMLSEYNRAPSKADSVARLSTDWDCKGQPSSSATS